MKKLILMALIATGLNANASYNLDTAKCLEPLDKALSSLYEMLHRDPTLDLAIEHTGRKIGYMQVDEIESCAMNGSQVVFCTTGTLDDDTDLCF